MASPLLSSINISHSAYDGINIISPGQRKNDNIFAHFYNKDYTYVNTSKSNADRKAITKCDKAFCIFTATIIFKQSKKDGSFESRQRRVTACFAFLQRRR
jgi:hypothetical protein